MKLVYIPIEVTARELDSKALLAGELARLGAQVVLGRDSEIYSMSEKLPPSLLLRKSVGNQAEREFNASLQSAGTRLHAQDEEAGIVYKRYRDFYLARSSLHYVCSVDEFYCWSEEERATLASEHPECQGRVKLAGGLRTALWGKTGRSLYQADISAIQNSLGKFILFNTNFGTVNSARGPRAERAYRRKLGEPQEKFANEYEREAQTIELFQRTIGLVLGETDLRVVIRPHPGESPKRWQRLYQSNPRVFIASSGPVSPWIQSAQLVVQNRCTTGLEAMVSQVPTIDLEPPGLDESPLRQNGSPTFSSTEALKRALYPRHQNSEIVFERASHMIGAGSLAPIANFVREISDSLERSLDVDPDALRQIGALIRPETTFKSRISATGKYTRRKSPNIPRQRLVDLLQAYKTIVRESAENIEVVKVGPNCFLFSNPVSAEETLPKMA